MRHGVAVLAHRKISAFISFLKWVVYQLRTKYYGKYLSRSLVGYDAV